MLFTVAVLVTLTVLQTIAVNWWSLGVAGAGALFLGAVWLLRITPAYVKPAADPYADALIATANEPTATTELQVAHSPTWSGEDSLRTGRHGKSTRLIAFLNAPPHAPACARTLPSFLASGRSI